MALSGEYVTKAAVLLSSSENANKTFSHTTPPSDHHLVLAAQSGSRTAFGELWELYSRRIYRTVLSITKNPQDAEDAQQDCFLRAFLALESFESRANFYTWLTRIAINSALGVLRKRRYRPETSLNSISQQEEERALEDLRDLAPNPEQIFEQQQRHAKLMRAIHKLPANLRDAVETRIAEDCSVKEMAYQLKISQTAAKSRLYRARTRLGTLLTGRYGPRSVGTRSAASLNL